jgi:hypothetical protein
MGLFAKLFGATPREQLKGISLGRDAAWEVTPASNLPAFLRALPQLLPPNSILYLEGGTPPEQVKAFLDAHCVPEESHVAMGTIWPRPQAFHLPATGDNLSQLAQLAEKLATPQAAIHLHVYAGGRVLLEWYDAFWKDPFYLSSVIPDDKVRSFCSSLSLTYKNLGVESRGQKRVRSNFFHNRKNPVVLWHFEI